VDNQSETEFYLLQVTNQIKNERKARNISQLKLAEILGHSSPNYVAKIENRAKGANYNLKHLLLIAKAFSMDIRDLLPSSMTKEYNAVN